VGSAVSQLKTFIAGSIPAVASATMTHPEGVFLGRENLTKTPRDDA